jgi:flagellar hook-associated protein FlgK
VYGYLIDSLSKIVNVSYNETEVQNTNGDNLGGTNFSLYINGEKVVEGKDYRKLICESSKTKNNQTDNDDLYKIYWEDTKMEFSATAGTAGGSLKALFEVRDGDNLENFKGKVTKADSYSLTVENTSIDNIKSLNLPDKDGKITVNNISYSYDSWEAQVDAQGNIKSVTFNLSKDKAIADPEKTVAEGYLLNAGSAINARGIPYYMTQLNEFVRNFSEMFNQIESKGQNLNGDTPPTFFEAITNTAKVYDFSESEAYSKLPDGQTATINSSSNTYYRMTAANFSVNKDVMNDVSLFATSTDYVKTDSCDIVDELKKLQSEKTVYRGDKAESFLETIISNVSVDTEKAETYNKLYSNLEQTIANQRTSVSGVDEDEEAYIQETGEFVFGKNVAASIKDNEKKLSVTYVKTGFDSSDARPEYYYNCKDITNAVTLDAGGNVPHDAAGDIIYSDPSKVVDFKFSSQEIKYTVANSTDITVNTQAKDVMDTGIKRDVDELIDVVQNAVNAHDKVSQIKKMMQQQQYSDKDSQAKLKTYLEAAEQEADYADNDLQKTYSQYITRFDDHLNKVNLAHRKEPALRKKLYRCTGSIIALIELSFNWFRSQLSTYNSLS